MNDATPRRRPLWLVGIALLVGAFVLSGRSNAGEVSVAHDEMVLFPKLATGIQGGGSGVLNETGVDALNKVVGHKRIIVRIKSVTNISGHNPMNTDAPLLNFNGVAVTTVAELVALAEGRETVVDDAIAGASLTRCVRTTAMHTIIAPPGAIYGANFDIDPATLECRTAPPGIAGQGNFSITDAPGDPANTAYFVGSPPPNTGDWTLSGGATGGNYSAGSTVTFEAVSNAGKRLQVSFRVTTGSPSTIQILSLTPK